MALIKGTNAYGTVVEADAYFEDRADAASWLSATVRKKANVLITATSILDELSWAGYVSDELQVLAHPRVVNYFDPRLGRTITLDGTSTPTRVIYGSFELAFHLLNNEGILDSSDTVDGLSIGPIHLRNIRRPNLVPPIAKRLIQPLLINQGASTWWRAN